MVKWYATKIFFILKTKWLSKILYTPKRQQKTKKNVQHNSFHFVNGLCHSVCLQNQHLELNIQEKLKTKIKPKHGRYTFKVIHCDPESDYHE